MSERATGISQTLVTYFQERPNQVVTIAELEKSLPQWDRRQLFGGMYNLLQKDVGEGIELLRTGIWRYCPNTATELRPPPGMKVHQPDHMQFEILKTTPDGKHMVGTDDEGNIYKITLLG
jgi:hypothetical protein